MADLLISPATQTTVFLLDEPLEDPRPVHAKQSWALPCPTCGHLLVEACTDTDLPLVLDTTVPVYVLAPRFTKDGRAIAVPSRGYPVHAASDCRPTAQP
jgi:hypothetical protein